LQAVLPFLAFDVVLVFVAEFFVELLPLRLVGVVFGVQFFGRSGGVEGFVPIFVVVAVFAIVFVV
jgi:hypothetical protein